MKDKAMRLERPARKAKTVRFQEKLHIIAIDERGVWHNAENLRMIKERALETGITAQQDRRIDLWNATFQDPVSSGLLCMWTTNFNTLRGLERFVCAQHRHRRMVEHRERVQAVISAQAYAGKVSVELAEISRVYSHASRIMAAQLGQADQFAVAADDLKSMRMNFIRGVVIADPQFHSLPIHGAESSAKQVLHPSTESSHDFDVRTGPASSPSAA